MTVSADLTPIYTATQMKACDTYTIETLGIPSQTLMERAARRAVRIFLDRIDLFPEGPVVLLCGGGNNGGDGFAMARFLSDGSEGEARECTVIYIGRLTEDGTPDLTRMSAECGRQYRLAAEAGVKILAAEAIGEALSGAAALVDAVFGIGLDRPVEGAAAEVISSAAESGLPVLAVDIPSGIHADTGRVMGMAIPAALTVTMQALKAGLLLYPGADYSGEVWIADLGISTAPVPHPYARLADEALLRRVLAPRSRRSHKGTYGRTWLLCGSEGMSGAAVLSTRGALRSGAGLAEVLTPEANRVVLQTTVPEAIVTVRDGNETISESIQRADGVVMGCGLGTSSEALEALRVALNGLPADGSVPMVLDADGLNLLASDGSLRETSALSAPRKQIVVTPHPAEMARLCGRSVSEILANLPETALTFARERGVTVVLKDAHTVIASPEGELYICTAGNAGMAKGGSGDVLAGIIGSLLTQNRRRIGVDLTAAEVAAAGVYLHACAGDLAAAELGEYGVLASDVIERIPLVCKEFSDSGTRMNV